ncbi:MAG: hypothetical protein AMJ81_08530 [Phycisphaerae bacterium SM23_33]|nr:MAG: hypothetical protein AMJ81_08530 [Phycisphaerae bacterium SM23_33]
MWEWCSRAGYDTNARTDTSYFLGGKPALEVVRRAFEGRNPAGLAPPAPKGAGTQPAALVHEIHGRAWDATPDVSEKNLAKLAAAASDEQVRWILGGILRRPAPSAVVTLQGESLRREMTTDLEGRFEFAGLPRGEYEISTEVPSRPAGRQAKRMAAAKQQVVLDGDRSVTLELRADLITVTGRITDTQGRPIAGAKVTWIWEPTAHVLESGEAMRRVESRSVSTVSRADGSYELRGLVPPDVLPTARRLNEGNGYSIYHVVRVEADGFEQGKARVLPVTKELHDAARRLLMAWKAQEIRTKGSSKIRAKDGLPVPSSTGNTITNVDVVLARAGAAATQPAPEGAGTQPASAPSDSPATPPARPLAWRDEESEAIVTLSGEGLIKRLGPTASHANAEPPDKFADKGSLIPLDPGLPADPSDIRWQIVGHFYRNLRPGLTLVIRQRVKGQSLDAYWCELGKEGEAFYKPPGPLGRPSAPQPAEAQSRPSIVAGLSCQVRAAKPKLPFNEWPRFEVTLTNVSSEPIDLIATAEWPGGLPGPHYPCASLKITHPDGHYHMPSEDSATANPKAVRIQPGKSWSFTYPSTPDHPTYGEGPLPSLSALLPGVYVAEFAYAVREEVEKRRLGQDLVYAQSAGGPAGKPEKLWTGVVYAEPVKFEVVDDGSPQLAILRDVYAGKGLDKLRLELLLLDEKGPADSRSLRLRLHNTGDQPLYLGCRFGLVTKGPAGQTQPDFSGPRSGQVTAHPPNSQQTLGGWSFDLAGRKPGLYTLWAEYLSMGRDAKLLAKSNEIHLQVPAAPGGAGARPAAEATDDYSRAVARLKQPVPRGQGSPLHKALYKLHADGRRTPDDRELGVIKSLIADSKDIEARDTQGRTALHWGAWDAQLEIITLLLAKGADVSVMADAGWTPLHYAADATNDMQQVRQRVPEVMRLLLRAGADPFADIRPGNLLAGRPIDQVNPRRSRPGLASIVRELEGDTNTPAEIVEVVRLLWEAMEPGRRAALAQARPVAKSFLRSVAENDAAGLVKATWDRDIEMDRPKDWKTTADVIRRRYAGQLGRLTTIQEEEIDRGMAAFKVAPPEGDERWLLVIVARFSDGVWRVVMAEEKQREMTLIQPLEYVVGSHSKRLLVEQSPATQPAPGGAGTQPTTARAMSAVAAEPDQVAEEVTDDPAAAAASSRPAAGPGYEQAFQDLYETLGRRYPCFALKGIAWKKVGQELLPRSRQVKSDQEFGLLCMELVARLEDTHARLEPGAAKLPPAPVPLWDPGFACLIDDRGQPVVYHVDKVSPAQRAGVKVGMTVTSINGKLAGQVLKEQMALLGRYFGYSSQRVLQYDGGRFLARQMQERAKVELGMRDPSGKAYSFELEATLGVRYIPRLPVPIQGIPDSADVSWKMLPDNIGYVRVRRIRANLLASLDKAVAELKSARGLIIDVRGNTGGGFDASAAFDNFSPGKQTHRPQFLGSIAVLVDEHCISAGEGWTSWFVANKRGRLFGSATAGASSRKETYTLSNGLYKVVIPVKAYAGFLHRPIERRGLEPDVPVRITASDLAAGRDTVLDAARQHLLQSPAAQPAPEGAATRPAVR